MANENGNSFLVTTNSSIQEDFSLFYDKYIKGLLMFRITSVDGFFLSRRLFYDIKKTLALALCFSEIEFF
jgi:hypothetical protein